MLKPQGTRIFLLPDKKKTETDSGIYVGDTLRTKTEYGTVESIGDEVSSVTIGQRVLFNSGAALPMEYEGINYLMVKEIDLIAIVE